MSTGLTGRTRAVIELKNVKGLDLSAVLDELNIDSGIKWTYGTGANQANVLFHDNRDIGQGANETLDLYASGSLKDAFGDILTMEAIKFLFIKNTSTDLTVSVFGGGANDLLIMGGTTDPVELPPGSFMLWACPTAAGIVTTSNKNLKLTVSGGSGSAIIQVTAMGLD